MENGGNKKALEYFHKNGVISQNDTTIDYKSSIVQRYKNDQIKIVENILSKNEKKSEVSKSTAVLATVATVAVEKPEKKIENDFFKNTLEESNKVVTQKVIFDKKPVQNATGFSQKSMKAKKIDFDFDNFVVDDGCADLHKKADKKTPFTQDFDFFEEENNKKSTKTSVFTEVNPNASEKLEELKNKNCKAISSS